MEFLAPQLLAGALAGVLPIIVHLIHRERPKVVPFTVLSLVRLSAQTTARSKKLRHLLLLLLRILLIVLFAMILARPFSRHASFAITSDSPTQAVIVLDDSFLMGFRDEQGTSHLQRAQTLASGLIRNLPPGGVLGLLPASQEPLDFTVDLSSVLRALELAQPSGQIVSCPLAIQRAYEMFGRSTGSTKDIYVFSNLSAGAWKQVPVNIPEDAEETRLAVIDVGPERPENLVLTQAEPSSFAVDANTPIRIDCAVHNSGPERNSTIDLLVNGQKRASRALSVAPGQTTHASLPCEFHEPGMAQGVLRIVDEDALPLDNERYFSVRVFEPLNVTVVRHDKEGQDAFFIAHALSPAGLRGRERVNLSVIDAEELPAADLGQADTVLLVNIPQLEGKEWQRLFEFVEKGGGLGIIAGNLVTPQHYSNLPKFPVQIVGTLESRKDNLALSPVQHPFLDKFREEGLRSIRLPTFNAYLDVERPAENSLVQPLAFFADGRPALLEHQLGRGRVFFYTSSFSVDWSNFPKSVSFPPFVYEFASYLAGRKPIPTGFLPGSPVSIPLRQGEDNAVIQVFEPGSETPITLTVAPGSDSAQHTTGQAVGNAQVFIKVGDKTRKFGYSINIDAAPDHYRHLAQEEVVQLFPKAIFLTPEDDLTHKVAETSRGAELAPSLLLLLLLLLCLESIMGNRIYQ
jgi:hypothetical protein